MMLSELEELTGLDNDTVRKCVRALASKGLLVLQRGERGRQTWLPAGDSFLAGLFGQNPKTSDSEIQNPKTSDSGSCSSSSNALVASYLPQEQEEGAESENFGFWKPDPAVKAALDAAGIREPKRSQLAGLEHVTPELIEAHVEQAKRDGLSLGTAIHRIQHNWDVDLTIVKRSKAPNGHDFGCSCRTCQTARNNVAFGTHCPDCWKELNSECRCSESEDE
jgi:hypothetical protein